MEQVFITPVKVKVGQRYSDEGGYSFTYLGNGKIGEISSNPFDQHNKTLKEDAATKKPSRP